ncbi:MAG: glutaredoxin family protein [Actinobacteria bacterium]|nr:glutaredoxin family protein [Actinomycetota bacterium]
MSRPLTLYTTPWCGYCFRLKRQLEDAKVAYREVNVDEDVEAGALIAAYTGGPRTVPTLHIGDRMLVNPTLEEVHEALRARPS